MGEKIHHNTKLLPIREQGVCQMCVSSTQGSQVVSTLHISHARLISPTSSHLMGRWSSCLASASRGPDMLFTQGYEGSMYVCV